MRMFLWCKIEQRPFERQFARLLLTQNASWPAGGTQGQSPMIRPTGQTMRPVWKDMNEARGGERQQENDEWT